MLLKKFAGQIVITFTFFVCVYSGVAAAVYFSFPSMNYIDTEDVDSTYFDTQESYIVMGRRPLMRNAKRILVYGSSTIAMGIRPHELSGYMTGYEVSNVGRYATNITQLKQIVELMIEAIPEESRDDTTFVIGMVYQDFRSDSTRKNNRVTVELERFGLYRMRGGHVEAVAPEWIIRYSDLIFLPFIYLNHVTGNEKERMLRYRKTVLKGGLRGKSLHVMITLLNPRRYFEVKDPKKAPIGRDDVLPEKKKKAMLKMWHDKMGTADDSLDAEQFRNLNDVIDMAHRAGITLFVVDLPAPEWHQERSVHFRNYQAMKKSFIEHAGKYDDVHYVNMQDMNDEKDFRDSTHPKPFVTRSWSRRLAREIWPFMNNHGQ